MATINKSDMELIVNGASFLASLGMVQVYWATSAQLGNNGT